ncbi:MAG: glutamate-5-semialdehyde dehydrogenase [Planctomycetes bacterium]|nr:glutamate-5-semialdehyde dehydrogenase [Planctomycetota bacterium]
MTDLAEYTLKTAKQAKRASRLLAVASGAQKTDWLYTSAAMLRNRAAELMEANNQDLENAAQFGLITAAIDRLRLTEERLNAMAAGLEEIVMLPDPIGEIIDSKVRPNGLLVTKVRVPLGVVFIIYESRPNVTVDAAAICVKSGNAVILRGGKEAFHSNRALHTILSDALDEVSLPRDAVQLVNTTDREAVGHFLKLHDLIDVTIPRGGKSLIERVADEATMPVIKHFDGICHVYVDRAADLEMAESITLNSKCQRPGLCNAAETLLVHAEIAEAFLPLVAKSLQSQGVELRCCDRSRKLLPESRPATEEDFRTEYLDLILSVKIVDDLEQAVRHIEEFGSHHTDTIVTNDLAASERFTKTVDSSAVFVNASTRFNDGGEFGLGAEIGISTDKFHARGPCGLQELTSYKYVVHGSGQIK